MNNIENVYLTLILIGFTILVINGTRNEKEHFGNPLNLLKKIGKGLMDFFINFIDILLVIADVFMFLAMIPFILMDVIILLVTWLHPITMIKGVVKSVISITKILFLMLFDVVIHIIRVITAKIFSYLKGGLWGIPHTPYQHHTHDDIESEYADRFGDHHHGPHINNTTRNISGRDEEYTHIEDDTGHLYRPLRCYKGVGSEGWINMISTIICPPLGVFMSFGLKGYLKIFLCCLLSLVYYVPGLIYALLITSHLGLGRKITAKDCGGLKNYGLRVAGCTSINNEKDCKAATIPGWRDKKGNPIPACVYDSKAQTTNKCFNIIYPSRIHTSGSNIRRKGEIGNEFGGERRDNDTIIDNVRETATDKFVEGTDKIEYNPTGLARDRDCSGEECNLNTDDHVPIPEGPWTFVGGD